MTQKAPPVLYCSLSSVTPPVIAELLTWKAAHKAAPKHVFLSKAVNDRLGPASLTA